MFSSSISLSRIFNDVKIKWNSEFNILKVLLAHSHVYSLLLTYALGLPWWLSSKEPTCQCRRCGFNPWAWKISWRKKWQPTPVFLPGKFHGQSSLVSYRVAKESDMTWSLNNNSTTILFCHYNKKAVRQYLVTECDSVPINLYLLAGGGLGLAWGCSWLSPYY